MPPGRTSISSTTVPSPHHSGISFGSVQTEKTCARGASKIRSTRISSSFGVVTVVVFIALTACLTSFAILASSAFVNFLSAKATGHMEPSSSFALSLKPNIAYLSLNFAAFRKKQTTFPSLLAYAGIPYQVFGVSSGAASLTIA